MDEFSKQFYVCLFIVMEDSSTPKLSQPRCRKLVRPSPSTSFKSPVINKMVKKIDFEFENATEDDLKNSTVELWQKNENLKKEIKELNDHGYKEEQLQWYIDKLHEYNEIKDVAQMVMGRIAVLEEVTVRTVHEEFGMTQED